MRVSIDWISINLPYSSVVSLDSDGEKYIIPNHYRDEFPELTDFLHSFPDWKTGGGNRVFDRSVYSKLGGFTIFWKNTLPYTLVEITGTGCKNLRDLRKTGSMAYIHSEYITRLDVACDIETDIRPKEFTSIRDENRFASYADIKSETGETYYVGSRSSDRFCRVYRYNPPHPRSDLLRIEFQLKKGNGKIAASSLRGTSVREIAQSLLSTFGFRHPVVAQHIGKKGLASYPRASRMGKTERWLFQQVLPACEKLISDGNTEIVDIFGKKLYALFNARLIQEENNRGY